MEGYTQRPLGPQPAQRPHLPAKIVGAPTRAAGGTVVLLHGFTQNRASWGPLLPLLSPPFSVIVPDAPGHGAASGVATDLWATADLLAGTLVAAGACKASWVGYSMGGRTALHLALAHPEIVSGLVLISSSAGIEDNLEREARRRADDALAERIEHRGDEGLQGFLAEWLAQPLFATLPPEQAGLDERLANSAAGLASSLRLAGAGAQQPLWQRLPELGHRCLPVLLLVGGLDRKYVDHARRMAAAIGPTASVRVVDGAGHACHLERPGEVGVAIAQFLASNSQTNAGKPLKVPEPKSAGT